MLLVHHDTAARHELLRLFRASGVDLDLHEAADSGVAMAMLEESRFDCVVIDHMVSPAGGIEVLKQVRRLWGGRGPAALMITPRGDLDGFAAAIEAGAQSSMFSGDPDPLSYRYGLLAAMSRMRQESERHEILAELERANDQLSRFNKALQESEQRFRNMFQTAPHGMALTAADGRWLMVNPALCKMLGYTATELLEANWQSLTHPDDLDTDLEFVRQMLAGEIFSYNMEKRFIRKNGDLVWILLSISMVSDDEGKPLHFVAEILDLTEIKAAQRELHQVHRLEAVGQLTGGVAHDFNNLLMAMQLNLEVLAEAVAGDEIAAQSMRMLNNAVGRGTQLTQQLLAFARRQPLVPEVLDVNALMDEVVAFVGRTLREDIDIVADFGAGVWPCEVDPGQFQNALLNLTVNASDAMPQGGRLTLTTGNAEVREALQAGHGERIRPGEYVVITVGDTGSGMPQPVIDRAFEPFFTTKDVGQGTGLGLSMVYGFVKQSGGCIRIDSALGQGTWIHIYLPRFQGTPPRASAIPPLPVAAPEWLERILVVEDNDGVRDTMLAMLRKEGYTALGAGTGREAMALLDGSSFRPQLLISDVVLPDGITGREVAEALLVRVPECRVLFMSGYAENVLVHGGRVDEGMTLLHKPFSRAVLMTRIRELMDRPGFA